MIKNLFTFGLLATQAAAQTTAPPATDDDDDRIKCDFSINGAKHKCEWYQQCYDADEENAADDILTDGKSSFSLNGCINKGNKVCAKYEFLGQNGKIVGNTLLMMPTGGGCHPSSTCCDGACCTENQECLPRESGTFSYGEFDKKKMQQEFPSLDAEMIARNGWKLPGGEEGGDPLQARPMHCVDVKFDTATGGKAVFTPVMAMALLIGSAIAGFRRNKIEGFFDKIAPAFIMLSGFFLMLTEGWVFALFTALVAAATMAAPRTGFKGGALVLVQLMFCWIYFGGDTFFVSLGGAAISIPGSGGGDQGLKNYFKLAGSQSINELETSCSAFYDFYKFVGDTKPWDTPPGRTTWGLCSDEFVGFQVIMAYVNAFALFTMTTHTLMDYLSPLAGNAKSAQSVTNPVAGADNA